MGTIILAGTAVLVLFGFGNHVWWFVAAAVLLLYARYGRGSSSAGTSGAPASATSYREYRERRDQQAKWERRYRRERPFETRRQTQEKSK